MCNGSLDSIHWSTRNCGNVENSVQHGTLGAERLAGSRRQSILGWCGMQWMHYSVYTRLGVCSTRCMLNSVYSVLGVCYTRCMLYSVYAVLGVNSWSWHGEMERDDLTSCYLVMVELRTTRREMRGDRANHHVKLGLKRISCESQCTIPDMAGTSSDPACNNTQTRSSQTNEVSRTPNFWSPLVFSTLFSSSSPSSLFLI